MNRDFRSIFVSDVHLGTRGSQPARLTKFLKEHDSDYLFLVGDILDGWHRRGWYWDDDHSALIDTILGRSRSGTKVIYVSGNHDEFLRVWSPVVPGISFCDSYVYVTGTGGRVLVIHGDSFDSSIRLARMGHRVYTHAQEFEDWLRSLVGLKPKIESVSRWFKHRSEDASAYFASYHEKAIAEAILFKCHGVICGHVHKPELIDLCCGCEEMYMNCGDWVENCTALVEDHEGKFSIMKG